MSRHEHYWLNTGIPHPLVFLNSKFRYDCSVCGKEKYFRNQPVNPLVPSAQEYYRTEVAKGNAHLVISPPILLDQSQETEGRRYAQIILGHQGGGE